MENPTMKLPRACFSEDRSSALGEKPGRPGQHCGGAAAHPAHRAGPAGASTSRQGIPLWTCKKGRSRGALSPLAYGDELGYRRELKMSSNRGTAKPDSGSITAKGDRRAPPLGSAHLPSRPPWAPARCRQTQSCWGWHTLDGQQSGLRVT